MANPDDPIKAAFENAVRDFKATLGDEKLLEEISKTKSIDDVYDATVALQKEQAEKGRLRHLAKIQPYLEGLRSYANVIEVFIQSKQDVLSLIWGPIKLLLHWTNNLKQSFDAIVDALADIGLLLPEFQQVKKLFSQNEHIKDVLVFFFRDILDFYLIVLKFFRKTYWGLIFESMWTKQREKISLVRGQIQRHTLLLRREVGLEHIQEAHNAQMQALEHYEKTEKSFRRQEYQSIKTDVSPRTYEDKLDSFHARVCQGTGRWLLRDPTFAKWLDRADSSVKILWLQGIPGSGKTFLSSTVVHKAKEVDQTHTIYAFLSYTFSSSLSALSILHSIIFQLVSGYDDLQEVLCQSGGETLKSSIDSAANLLKTLLACAGRTYIVIDGLDEIDETQRCRLLKQLLDVSKTCQEVRILLSSRGEDDIAGLLKDQASIRVDSRNAGSIQQFVNQRTAEWFSKCKFLPEAQAEIQGLLAPLASNAKGMFLYAEVVLSSMDSLDDMGEIREELRVLPESLDAAYSRILDRINRLNHPLKNKVRKILGWVGCAPIPLTIQEIEQALVVSREGIKGNGNVIAVLNMPRICGPIVEVVDDYVQFVHFTVKEYLFSSSIDGSLNFTDAICSLATCCITYLCQMHHGDDMSNEEIDHNILSGAYRLHNFADITWFDLVERYVHLPRQGSLSSALIDALETLRCERSKVTDTKGAAAATETSLEPFKLKFPALHDMLCKVAHVRRISAKGNFDEVTGASWTSVDPLTISTTSVRIYQQFNGLSCRTKKQQNDEYERIRWHYGQRPFKCGFFSCPFRRHGFESRSLQRSHLKHHDRPWKCWVEDCEYADGGFLSRKMRDDHYRSHGATGHQETPQAQNAEADEIQPLLFDLVKADKVDAVRDLLDQFDALPPAIRGAITEYAASLGSVAMFDLIEPFNKHTDPFENLRHTIRATNKDLFNHLMSRSMDRDIGVFPTIYASTLSDLLRSDSEEIFDDWEKYIDISVTRLQTWSGSKRVKSSPTMRFGLLSIKVNVINATGGHPDREDRLITHWEHLGVLQSFSDKDLGAALVNVARATCSVKLAKYFIDNGADVNYVWGVMSLTPLHHAARKRSPAAAEMMRYLLLQGADPEFVYDNVPLKIRDEKGAKGVAEWLGMSWDELVAKTKEEREIMKGVQVVSRTETKITV